MDNYICINGKKAELTEEQMRALGLLPKKKNPFEHAGWKEKYYAISIDGTVTECCSSHSKWNAMRYKIANYCTDKEMMEQRALYETLHRLLWRYSMSHQLSSENTKCIISYSRKYKEWQIFNCQDYYYSIGEITYASREIAQMAIKTIIEPFLAEHPEFEL